MESELTNTKPAALVHAEEWFGAMSTQRRAAATPVLDSIALSGANVLKSIEKLPTRKDEPYRYSDLESLYRNKYIAATGSSLVSSKQLEPYFTESSAGRRLVFVNGVMDTALSDLSSVPKEVFYGSIADLSEDKVGPVLEKLSFIPEINADRNTGQGSTPFAALNLACLADAALLIAPPGFKAEQPFQVVFLSTTEKDALSFTNYRFLVLAGQESEFTVMQNSVGQGGGHFSNGLSRIILDKNATVDHFYIQEQPEDCQVLDTILSEVFKDARYSVAAIGYGADKARLNVQVELSDEGAFGEVNGAMFGSGRQNLDFHTSIRHNAENTQSAQQQKNIVGEASDIVFKGRIRVEQVAQGTDSSQLCRSLMLSDKGTVTVMPSLEIIADQVKCSHGATVSDMSEEDLFYFAARGIDRQKAQEMIVLGFANEIANKISCEKFRTRIFEKISRVVPKDTSVNREFDFQSI